MKREGRRHRGNDRRHQRFTRIDNEGFGVIAGEFGSLAEGGTMIASFNSKAYAFKASYPGGDSNDLVLAAMVPEPAAMFSLLAGLGLLPGLRLRPRKA